MPILPVVAPSIIEPSTTSDRHVTFLHPGYDAPTNELFCFLAYDSDDGGIDGTFVLVACGMVAGNRWDGFLTKGKLPVDPIDLTNEPILGLGTY